MRIDQQAPFVEEVLKNKDLASCIWASFGKETLQGNACFPHKSRGCKTRMHHKISPAKNAFTQGFFAKDAFKNRACFPQETRLFESNWGGGAGGGGGGLIMECFVYIDKTK